MMLPMPPSTTPAYMDDDVFDADEGMKGDSWWRAGPPAIAVMPVPSAKANAVGAINVDPHIGCRGGDLSAAGPQGFSDPRPGVINSVSRIIVANDHHGVDPARLVDEDADVEERTELPGRTRQRRADRGPAPKPNTSKPPFCRISAIPSVRMKLGIVALSLERGSARARYTRDQGKVDRIAKRRQHGTGKQNCDERSEGVAESGLHAEAP